jgi:tryptophan 2,3-dioxygenase
MNEALKQKLVEALEGMHTSSLIEKLSKAFPVLSTIQPESFASARKYLQKMAEEGPASAEIAKEGFALLDAAELAHRHLMEHSADFRTIVASNKREAESMLERLRAMARQPEQ